MRGLFLIGTVIVLGCAMWVSFHHTLDLFHAGGFTKELEWPATIAAEVAFIMGILSSFDSRRKGYSPHWSARLLFYAGLGVVGWSNVRAGFAYGWTGIILGVLIPIFLYLAESVLANAYIEVKGGRNTQEDVTQDENTQSPNRQGIAQRRVAQNEAITQTRLNRPITQEDVAQVTQNEIAQEDFFDLVAQEEYAQFAQELIAQERVARDEAVAQSSANERIARSEAITQNEVAREENAQDRVARQEEVAQEHVTRNEVIAQVVAQKSVAQNEEVTQERVAQIAREQIAQEEVAQAIAQEPVTQNEEVARKESPKKEQVAQGKIIFLKDKIAQTKISDKLKKYKKAEAIAHAIKCAIAHEQQQKELPTKRELMELAGCTDHAAREALKILREVSEELSQTG